MSERRVCTFHRQLRHATREATGIPFPKRTCEEPSGHGSGGVETTCRSVARWVVRLSDLVR